MNTQLLKTIFLIITIVISTGLISFTQTPVTYDSDNSKNLEQVINIDDINQVLLQKLVLMEINKLRKSARIEELTPERILTLAAKAQADQMSEYELSKIEDPDETGALVQEFGGTFHATELVARVSVKKSSDFLTYGDIAEKITTKWMSSKKYNSKLLSPENFFIGISGTLDEFGKKLYISVVFGNYFTYNGNLEGMYEMEIPVTEKTLGLNPHNNKICDKIEKYNLSKLQDGLYIEDDIIYFKTNDLKTFKKIIKDGTSDGLAVDIIQKEQYPCSSTNLVDFELSNRGVLTKPLYASKIYSYNEFEYPESKTKLLVDLGELPLDISGDYELNLVIIKEKHYCKDIPQSFLLDGGFKPFKDLRLLADTVTINSKIDFIPETSDDEFMLRIPLERGKNTFTYKEVKQYLDKLDVPPFIITEMEISAFSSIDESSNKNMIQNHKKAESIIKALENHQEEKFTTDILAQNSWSIFQSDVVGTEYEQIALMGLKDAVRYIKKNDLTEKLEPILVNHRFAQIQIKVIYDLRDEKEQIFVLHHFNKAIENSDLVTALAIQKYIFKMRLSGKYNDKSIIEQNILFESKFAGLLMNKYWLQKKYELIEDDILYKSLQRLHELSPNNPYIHFNLLAKDIEYDIVGDDYKIYKTQTGIDNLYNSTIGKRTIDNLNLEYQFKVIAAMDTLVKPSQKMFESLNRIKSIFSLESASAKSSLQLAYLFINHEDYDFASRLLEVFIEDTKVDEELLFTYLSLCSVSDYKYFTSSFTSSMKKAAEINPTRFCKLFDGNHFSLRILENPEAKKIYCNSCN